MTTATKTNTGWTNRLRAGLVTVGIVGAAFILPGCFGGGGSNQSTVCGDGPITIGWGITGNGNSLSCAQAGATEVDIRVDTDQMTAPFDCNAHVGTTPAVAGGVNHSVSMALLDAAGNVLSSTPDQTVFVPCNTAVDLGNIELSLTN